VWPGKNLESLIVSFLCSRLFVSLDKGSIVYPDRIVNLIRHRIRKISESIFSA